MSSAKSSYSRLEALRKRVETVKPVKTKALKTSLNEKNELPPPPAEPEGPIVGPMTAIEQTINSAKYDKPIVSQKTGKGYGADDRAFRQMNVYFDYASYAEQCAHGKPNFAPKLSKKQIESLKKQKKQKKMEKLKEWLYND
ncbi:hypothetical protein O9G_000264 [Rozella allomycis CSF55]|uniref:Uncharacterized protein n=1 Tax=Rozella allomycis (strain CSF55) TaxID=988480 RepID=A0A075AST4_ROZAC|nr:hypothetical protein O9G_000264 [Rozella allomycis CSF55]|eukprot:EPZ31785.1 hypothetical protein O9G_000264 [Rozella allomycis CSF55]